MNNIRSTSKKLKADPLTSVEKAVWWIEHINEFKKDNLKYAGADLSLFEYLLMDIFIVFIVVFLLVLIIISIGLKQIVQRALKYVDKNYGHILSIRLLLNFIGFRKTKSD